MGPSSLLLILASILSFVVATPSLAPRQTSSPQQYYLRTSIVDNTNDTGTPKGDLYVQSYHTGAGLSDVTLTNNISYALSGYLNTTINADSGETTWVTNITTLVANNETLYWDMCGDETSYGNWGTMTINLGNDDCNDFYADGDLLVFALGGWLACDWWHGVPQLFFITAGEAAGEPFQAPTSCSLVDLQRIEVSAIELEC